MAIDPRQHSIFDFTYDLPEGRIAQVPLPDRDASKLLVYEKGTIADHTFRDLPELLPQNALLVLNNTKVVNARLVFHRSTGARIEVLCLTPAGQEPVELAFAEQGSCIWECFVGNAKRWKEGETLNATSDGIVINAERAGPEQVKFTWEPKELTFAEVLERIGHVPLPPYMKRPDAEADKQRYNTVFAQFDGSVAAPTASLHFTQDILQRLSARGIHRTDVTLHVGAGTFLPVKSATMDAHTMHTEQVRVTLSALKAIREQLDRGPIIPVGTTALRTLESLYWHGVMLMQKRAGEEMDLGQWEPYDHDLDNMPEVRVALDAVIHSVAATKDQRLIGHTSLLIAPGYAFKFTTGLITNFHQPQSTLLLLVSAFLGKNWRTVYDHALLNNYRFLSYGDGSLLLPHAN